MTPDETEYRIGVLPDGRLLERRDRMTPCRGGASSTRLLCDDSHSDVGFRDS